MCGIGGILHCDRSPVDAATLRAMVDSIRHRGPDDAGLLVDGHVGLGHARLSIIDLSGGHQPMTTEDGLLAVTFNGEIFNYVELREELIARSHRFVSHSDTEVILHAYRQWGDACVDRFNGQWAFAVWDKRRDRLFLSRDRLGIRPLYYAASVGCVRFASEVKALLADPDVPRRIDPIGLDQVFTFWAPIAPRTVFEGIEELPPGHNLVVEKGRITTWPYWELDYEPGPASIAEEEWAEQLLELLRDATRLRLRSDVPVGAYVSGGLDSAITVALVKQISNAPLRTFSIAFDEEEFDESPYQEEVVRSLGTKHQQVRCSMADIARTFPDVIRHAERPVLRTAPAPLMLLAGLVRKAGYKVVVTGEGADEMLGGYDLFKEAKIRRFWAEQPGSSFRASLLGRLYPYLPNLQVQSPAYREAFFRVRPEDLASPFFSHLPRWELTSRLKTFFSAEMQDRLAGHDAYSDCGALLPEQFDSWPHFCQAQFLETVLLMPGYILSSQGDRMTMAHGVEGRFPFLDHRLAEMAARMPPRLKMKGLREKYILKRATRHLVPEAIKQRTKQPYRAPEAQSFFGLGDNGAAPEWVETLLAPARLADDGVFHGPAVQRLIEKVRSGQAVGIGDNMALVGILSTQLLIDQFIRNQPSVDRPGDDPISIRFGADSGRAAQPDCAVPVHLPPAGEPSPLDIPQGNPIP